MERSVTTGFILLLLAVGGLWIISERPPPPSVEPVVVPPAVAPVEVQQLSPAVTQGLLPKEPGIQGFGIQVNGEESRGIISVPDNVDPSILVVVNKGLLGGADQARPLLEVLRQQGVLGLAMEYRGTPDSWRVKIAAEDTVAGTLAAQATWPSVNKTILFGFSMGAEVSGVAVMTAPPGTYTYWLDGAGPMDLAAYYDQQLDWKTLIVQETGGTPTEVPDAYAERSPLKNVDAVANAGLQRVYIVHAWADSVVPATQSNDLMTALQFRGVPVTYFEVLTSNEAWACIPVKPQCVAVLPYGPANHESSYMGKIIQVLQDRVDGVPDAPKPLYHAYVEGATGTEIPLQ